MKNLPVFLVAFVSSLFSFSQSGSLDSSFDDDGIVTMGFGSYTSGEAVAIQPDGKIIVGATVSYGTNLDFTLLRYNANGSLDTTFNTTGIAHTDFNNSTDSCTAIALQPDGKIIASGTSIDILSKKYMATLRYNSDGTLDTTFGIAGKVLSQYFSTDSYGEDMLLQQDGKIVVVGTTKDALSKNIMLAIRYNPNGTIDTSFDIDGMVTIDFIGNATDCSSITQQPDGKLLLTGTNNAIGSSKIVIVRLNTDGSLDTNFDTDGKQSSIIATCNAFAIKVQADGKIVVAGTIEYQGSRDFIVLRYNNDGSVDTTFSSDGVVINNVGLYHDYCLAMAIDNLGNITVGGATRMSQQAIANFTLLRYTSSGNLDTTFNSNGIVISPVTIGETIIKSLAIQPDGKLVAVGFKGANNVAEIQIVRYNNTTLSTLSNQIAPNEFTIYPNPFSDVATLQTSTSLKNATINIIDVHCRIVKIMKHVFGKNVLISSDKLSSGVYFVTIFENNKLFAKSKFVVTQ
jgi:uncharacterized delta-60 repeat protein